MLLSSGCRPDSEGKICRSRGGESCAFDGAMIVLQPIADAAHVVHGPLACCSNSWEGRGVRSSAGELHKRGFCTDVRELDIVYGGEEKLMKTVRDVVAEVAPSAVFVHSTCVTGLIGEDIDATCRTLADELSLPVIPVHAPGFVGPKNLGNRIAGETLLDHVIGTTEPPETTPTDLVLIGEYNVAGDLDLVEPLLAEAGINLLSRITGNARFEEIAWAHRARVSAVVCSRALTNVAGTLQRTYDIPSIEVSFFGRTQIERSLRGIAALLEDVSPEAAGIMERVEEVIARRDAWLDEALAPYASLAGKKAVLYSGGVKSWSMVSTLNDLGIEVLAVGTKKASFEDEEKVKAIMGEHAPVVEDISPARIRSIMAEKGGDMLVAGGRNRYLAAKEGWPFVDVNQERHSAYAGYEGLVTLARDLHHSLSFYERTTDATLDSVPLPAEPTVVRAESGNAIDPIGNAASLGAVLAMQGVHRAVPLQHGTQGCNFLEKVLLVNHFNESVALATTKLFTEEVVLGSEDRVVSEARALAERLQPDVLALVSTSLPEVKGDDVRAAVPLLEDVAPAVIAVRAPDYDGGLQDGYAATIEALVSLAEPGAVDRSQVTVIAGSHLTPADFVELRETIEDFGLNPVFVTDLGVLDGSRTVHSALALGGTTVGELRAIGRSAHTIVVGRSLESSANGLKERFGTPYTAFDSLVGLAASDALVETLSLIAGAVEPPRLRRRRAVLVDAMRDAHIEFADKHIALALESDDALHVNALLAEMGVRVTVVEGSHTAIPADAHVVVGGSHAAGAATRLGIAHVEHGFPVLEHLGAINRCSIGYRGSRELLHRITATLMDAAHGAHAMQGGER